MYACAYQVAIEAVGIERSIRCHELGNGLQAGIERTISSLFVGIHLAAPETLAVEAHVPVREVVLHKIADSSSGFGGFVGLVGFRHLTNEGVEFGQDPAVDFCKVFSTLTILRLPAIHVGIEGEEGIGVVQRAEELTAHFRHTFRVELQVVPRRTVREHVPAYGICAIGIHCAKGVNGVTQTFGHLVAGFVEHQTVADDVAECYLTFNHRVDSVQREEPSTCLVHTFRDEVSRTGFVGILKRIVVLCVRHRAGVEPYVNQVELAVHRLSGRRNKHDAIHVRTMQVNHARSVVGCAIVAYLEFRPGVSLHHTGFDRLVDLRHQFLNRTDADLFLSVLCAPDRQRRAPVTRTREVPVVEVLQPFAEAACTG